MKITNTSPLTRKSNTRDIPVTEDQLDQWGKGKLIQDVMPHLSADDREFLISGMTPEDWEVLFGNPSDGDPSLIEADYNDIY